MRKFVVDIEVGYRNEFEPHCEFTRDYLGKEEVYKLLKEFPPEKGRKDIYEDRMSWTYYPNKKLWVDFFVRPIDDEY